MKIGVVTYDYDPPIGGLGVHVQRLRAGLRALDAGREVNSVVLSPSPGGDVPLPGFVTRRWRRRGGAPLFSLALFFLLPRFVRSRNLSLLHVHGGSGGVLLLRKPHVPLVVTCHHTYRDEADVYRDASRFTFLRKRAFAWIEKRTYFLADRIICVSQGTLDRLHREYGVPEEKLVLIENAVSDAFFAADDVPREANLLLFAGRLEPRKGLPVLLRAFALLRNTYQGLRLRMVGENLMGTDALRRHLTEAGLHESDIECAGFVTEDAYLRELKRATVLVVPSLREGFGLTAAEGMATGTPVVASDCPGLRNVVRSGETGMLFRTGDADACAGAIARLLADGTLRDAMALRAREEARERFSLHRQARETLRCFRDVVSGIHRL